MFSISPLDQVSLAQADWLLYKRLMHEAAEPPKGQMPYAWIVGGLTSVSVCLAIITVSNGTTATKNAEALAAAQSLSVRNAEVLAAAQASGAARERSLQAQVDTLLAALKASDVTRASLTQKVSEIQLVERAAAKNLKDANGRIDELATELARLRDSSVLKDAIASKKKAEVDLQSATAALSEANAKAASAVARQAKVEEENLRLREAIARSGVAVGSEIKRGVSVVDKWAKLNDEFLAKIDADASIKKSASGLRYKVIEEGHPAKPNAGSTVKCRYEGRLIDGKVFDTTKARNNEPAEFPLNQVIPSWTEGVQKIGAGGKIIFYSPPSLAYGDEGQGPIPGNSVLIFEVELVEVTQYR